MNVRAARLDDLPRILRLQRDNVEEAQGDAVATEGFVTAGVVGVDDGGRKGTK